MQHLKQKRSLKVTQIETDAWKLSDHLSKVIKYLYKTDLNESVRTKMIREMLEDALLKFHDRYMNVKQVEEAK